MVGRRAGIDAASVRLQLGGPDGKNRIERMLNNSVEKTCLKPSSLTPVHTTGEGPGEGE
jgi:hypothetical protein